MSEGKPRRVAGEVKRVDSPANPIVKEIRSLALRKFRDRSGLFVAEGHKLARDALEAGWQVETLVLSTSAPDAARETAAKARARGARIVEAGPAVMEKIARRENAQPVIGVYRQAFRPFTPEAILPSDLWVALEGPRDPGNVGTIIRTADGLGVAGVVLVGPSVDPFGVEAVWATMGSIFHVPLARLSLEAFASVRAAFGGRVYGTHLAGTLDLRGFRPERPAIVLMGTERAGLTGAAADLCDALVRIPMAGSADSFNLAVATALVLFEAQRDRLPGA